VPTGIAEEHRHLSPACRASPAPCRRRSGRPPVPAHARRAGGVHGAARRGPLRPDLDAVIPPVAPLDVLAQQLVAESAASDPEGCTEEELLALARRSAPYSSLGADDFEAIVELRQPRRRHRARPPGSTFASRPRERRAPAAARRPPHCCDLGRCDPGRRRLPASSLSRKTLLSAPSTRTGRSSRWRATCSFSAARRGGSERSSQARSGWSMPRGPHRPSRSGWVRRRRERPSSPRRFPDLRGAVETALRAGTAGAGTATGTERAIEVVEALAESIVSSPSRWSLPGGGYVELGALPTTERFRDRAVSSTTQAGCSSSFTRLAERE